MSVRSHDTSSLNDVRPGRRTTRSGLLFLFLVLCAPLFGASFSVDTGIDYDEGYHLRWVTWKGYNTMGITDFPFDLGSYPADTSGLSILTLDTEDANKRYPRIRVGYQDSGRAIRMQLTDGGTAIDLSTATILVYSKKQSDDSAVRNGYDISSSTTYDAGGYLEWGLDSTNETTNSVYFYLKVTIGSDIFYYPTDTYIYVDVINKATQAQGIGTDGMRYDVAIPVGTVGKTFTWYYTMNGREHALDLAQATGKIYAYNVTQSLTPNLDDNSLSSLTYSGNASYTLQSGDLSDAGFVLCWMKLTKNSKTVTLPLDGFFVVKAVAK